MVAEQFPSTNDIPGPDITCMLCVLLRVRLHCAWHRRVTRVTAAFWADAAVAEANEGSEGVLAALRS